MTDESTPRHHKPSVTRRDFLKVLGIALGGALTTYGESGHAAGGGSLGAVPNAYAVYRVLTANAPLPGTSLTNPVGDFTAVVMMGGNTPLIYFHGLVTDTSFTPCTPPCSEPPDTLFLVNMNYGQTPPVVTGVSTIAWQGLVLYDNTGSGDNANVVGVPPEQLPTSISRIGTGDTNALGHYATTLAATDLVPTVSTTSLPGVYLIKARTVIWNNVARFGDAAPGGGQFGGIFGDVALADDDSVTFVAATTQGSSALQGSQGLFVANPTRPRASKALLRAGDLLPGTSAVIRSFGLVDVASDGGIVVQVSAVRSDGTDRRPGTALLQGDL